MLSDKQIEKFRRLYKARFGKEISQEEALEKSTRLVRLIRAVYEPKNDNKINLIKKI